MKHWVIMPYNIVQLQGGYRHATSNMQRMFCALVTITEQCVEEGTHYTVYILAEHTGISGSAVL
jgi:hypothetical protein